MPVLGEYSSESVKVSYKELHQKVARCAAGLRQMGVVIGDRVVSYIPNCLEAIVVMLATTSLGAIWSSTSPDFGVTVGQILCVLNLLVTTVDVDMICVQGVLDRFVQVKPKVLFSVNAVVYNGKTYDHLEKVKGVSSGLVTLEKVVVINFVKCSSSLNLSEIPKG
jgi:acetoacetyl-CoA synthetase